MKSRNGLSTSPRFWIAALILAIAAFVLLLTPGANAQTDLEQCFLDKINEARAAVGAGQLDWAEDIVEYTRDHSAAMASSGGLYHSTGAQLDAVLPDSWSAWGENVRPFAFRLSRRNSSIDPAPGGALGD